MSNLRVMPGFHHFKAKPFVRVSAFLDLCRCPRRFFYRYGCGLVPMDSRLPLKFGEAIHASIGWLFGHEADLLGSLAAFDKVWLAEHEAADDSKRNRANAQRIITAWMDNHRKGQSIYEPIKPTTELGSILPLATNSDYEIPFVMDFGLPIQLAGRIDFLARHRSTKELWTGELKTSSEVNARFFAGFEFNPQMYSYAVACRSWGLPVQGCFVEGLQVRDQLKTKETPPPVIQIQPINFHQFMLDEHEEFIRYKLAEYCHFVETRNFPKNFTGCNPYGMFSQPGYNCDYRNLCNVPDWQTNSPLFRVEEDQLFQNSQTPAQVTVQGKELV